ncbi:HAMP domain-containing sensor histidine kinase [Paenibacillus qinlingensis]|uniref:histidine kinase n=1 Tax=Paenibacillus qinlingensis TaxID=1837343 RepID=A0ABU1NSD5_9BACL|nr:HAMP domain-containing sensor histidine kinase [Paenibacillus qinlingensis]MDR6550343.1 signal transduction histidine kinase [Paenibacillus qinlingensis]
MFLTIKVKLLLGLFIIFLIALLSLNLFIVHIIDDSNEKIITEDLISLKKNSNIYIKQTFLINHFTNDQIYFQQIAKEMVEELRQVSSNEISAYTVEGQKIYTTNLFHSNETTENDLKQAMNGKTAYTISYVNGLANVYFAYPVVIDGKAVGILRFSRDFTLLYEQSKQIIRVIYYMTIAIFAAAFLFSYLLSRHITIPIIRLTQASTEVTSGNLNIDIDVKRKDEIGQLAFNFSKMLNRIKIQIHRIEKDRDRLGELNLHRKQFFDNVTHELKTPLTSILGYAEMIRANGWSDEDFFDKGMNHIIDESKRLHELVLKLLELSMESASEEPFEWCDIGSILTSVSEAMAFKAQRYQKSIRNEIEEDLAVLGNKHKLRQLFINLLDNAIKYGYPHTTIEIKAEIRSEMVNVIMTNQGETLSKQDLDLIFEPFYRGEKLEGQERGSRGLGLAICKSIINDHSGYIQISSVDQRIQVNIQLPYERSEGSEL